MVLPLSALFIIKALFSMSSRSTLRSAMVRFVPGCYSYVRFVIKSLIVSNTVSSVLFKVLFAGAEDFLLYLLIFLLEERKNTKISFF